MTHLSSWENLSRGDLSDRLAELVFPLRILTTLKLCLEENTESYQNIKTDSHFSLWPRWWNPQLAHIQPTVNHQLKQLSGPFVTCRWQIGGRAAGDLTPEEIIKVSFVTLLLPRVPEEAEGPLPSGASQLGLNQQPKMTTLPHIKGALTYFYLKKSPVHYFIKSDVKLLWQQEWLCNAAPTLWAKTVGWRTFQKIKGPSWLIL